MSVDTVGRLRALIDDVPDYWPLAVRVVVGGDLGTDDVTVEDVLKRSTADGPYVVLEPDDPYGVRDLIDDGLTARHALEDAELFGNGWLRYTRDEDGNIALDHVGARRIVLIDPEAGSDA